MSKLANLSLANRAAIALFTLIIAFGGVLSVTRLKQELIPAISLPMASVVTVVPGGSPEIIDEQVTVPVTKVLENIDGVEGVTTTSATNMSNITLTTEYGIDTTALRQEIKAAIDDLNGLPDNAQEPIVFFGSSSDLPVLAFTASSDASVGDLTQILRTVVVPGLERIDGVRTVAVTGGLTQRVTITPDQAKLAMGGASSQNITDALEANGTAIPAGTVTSEENGSLAVQAGTLVTSVEDIKGLPVIADGKSLGTIGDLATVELTNEAPTSLNRTNGVDSLSVSVTATQDADIVELSHAINDALPGLADKAGNNTEFVVAFDQAPFVEDSIKHLALEGVLGLLFAVVVILLFLMSARSTIVTAISIPLSVLVTFIGLFVFGYSLNMLTLSALTISLGRVVDDSIVVIENIKRHLSYGTPKMKAILTAVREVAGAITASTLTTIMVFVPIMTVGGMVGELFRPFSLTVAIAMASSLLVSLTIVPVLAYWFLPEQRNVLDAEEVERLAQEKEEKSFLQRMYVPVLNKSQKHPVITVIVAVALLAGSLALWPLLKTDFLGNTGQDTIAISQEFDSGTSLDEISDSAKEIEESILDTPGVKTVLFSVATGADNPMALFGGGTTSASYQITLEDDAEPTEVTAALKDRMAAIDEDTISVGADAMGFGSSTIDVMINSVEDADALTQSTDTVIEALSKLEYAGELENSRAEVVPNLQVTVDREKAAELGMTELQVSGTIAMMLSPQPVDQVRIDNSVIQIYMDNGISIASLKDLEAAMLPTATGMVPLTSIAELDVVEAPSTVKRVEGELSATVSVTPVAGELTKATEEIEAALADLELPAGITTEVGGVSQDQTEAFSQLGLAMMVAVLIVYALMVTTFRSLIQPLILLISIPFAAIGAFIALLITGTSVGVASLMGMLMLIGVVVTNAIVLIDLVNQYREQGMNVEDAVYHGSRQRLRPILMTAAATIFAMIPMASGITGGTGFISKDLAIVVIGGLISSTLLTLVLVPVLYRIIEGGREKRAIAKAEKREAARLAERARLGLEENVAPAAE